MEKSFYWNEEPGERIIEKEDRRKGQAVMMEKNENIPRFPGSGSSSVIDLDSAFERI